MGELTRVMIVPAGGEWLWAPMPLDGAAGAITAAVGRCYRATRLTDRLTVLVGDHAGDPLVEVNPYLPLVGRLYGVNLSGRGSAVFTGGVVRVGAEQRVMPLSQAHCERIVQLVQRFQAGLLPITPTAPGP